MSGWGDEDYDQPGWQPKDEILESHPISEVKTEHFLCQGRLYHAEPDLYGLGFERYRHNVSATPEAPVTMHAESVLVSSLTPFNCHRYRDTVNQQCETCFNADLKAMEEREENTKAYLKERAKQRSEARKSDAARKRRKLEDAASPTTATADPMSPISETPTVPPDASRVDLLLVWQKKLQKLRCKELGELCTANHLMKTGSKDELVMRITKCKFHGAPGKPCPRCGYSTWLYNYPDDEAETMPYRIVCRHYRGQGSPCGNKVRLHGATAASTTTNINTAARRKFTTGGTCTGASVGMPVSQRYLRPLEDSVSGCLAKHGLAAGFELPAPTPAPTPALATPTPAIALVQTPDVDG
mmetsp:Transcript_4357/g.7056  ORF Transcript_4357/g.7056 Transcript_4357/m.7056 type:complete len:355 (+) Transcript_4357:224-1288(+)|eukprot:CAMPEP_0174966676 /NCGR_PEP_ID=MMETSP0004_2-20121128/7156_1 /TAXON_ID=420556 /ORGANISM="Ochromonas sp., Strain CCMP1393" /LENGTH=354 /DNA_ID=CAMNT_0016215715 /DNA_START=277 /DNA_END=1341 /DNA_ORIENTATION=+